MRDRCGDRPHANRSTRSAKAGRTDERAEAAAFFHFPAADRIGEITLSFAEAELNERIARLVATPTTHPWTDISSTLQASWCTPSAPQASTPAPTTACATSNAHPHCVHESHAAAGDFR